jgi:carbonic anhydrase
MLCIPGHFAAVAVITLLLTLGPASFAAEGGPHWSYSGPTGPAQWGTLAKEYRTCTLGRTQSPIDIRDDVAQQTELPALNFDYQASTLKIIDNGHTIQVNYEPGSFLTAGGTRYELVQFHSRRPRAVKA